MPIETISKNGKRRYRWTFERVIEGDRIRKTKLIPAGLSAREADELGRQWDAEVYAIATGARKQIVTIGECVRIDLPPANRASRSLVKFVFGEEDEHEEALYGTANHRVSEGSRGRYAGQGTVQEARVQ
ncbi:hypothetical protein NUJ27_28390 [Burkholderia cenocepacia]|uniref:hypothetical protein n=1 Tax=Burkholderia cenocepacia TaxID=95486 RepID=UPI0021D7AA38|nr:hypothetical protein [Burkholderia cenocepacia]UXZ90575.1 hypothetical protein NUJ27_28390 [Burkholderia cenocepacia]